MIAFDTNILVYAEDPAEPSGKHKRAADLLATAGKIDAVIPIQVLGEFVNVCRKKKITDVEKITAKVEDFSRIFETPHSSVADITDAAMLAEKHRIQFFDALIVVITRRAGTTILISEDMQDGLEIDGLKIVNPFATANDTFLADYLGSVL
ncbi:MAG: PIN domain-containing protein [Sphingorhabdus sp.]